MGELAVDRLGAELPLEALDEPLGDGDVRLQALEVSAVGCGVDLAQVGADPAPGVGPGFGSNRARLRSHRSDGPF